MSIVLKTSVTNENNLMVLVGMRFYSRDVHSSGQAKVSSGEFFIRIIKFITEICKSAERKYLL